MWLPPEGERKRFYLVGGIGLGLIVLLLGVWWYVSPKDETRRPATASTPEVEQVHEAARKKDVEGLKTLTRSPNIPAASTAIYQLSVADNPQAHVPVFREIMNPTYAAPLRAQAVSAFARTAPTRESYQEVEKVARDDGDVQVKLAAISALEAMQPSWKSLNTLVVLMDHPDERVRAAALHALQAISMLRFDTDSLETKQRGYHPNDPVEQRRVALRRIQLQLSSPSAEAQYESWAKTEWAKQQQKKPGNK